MPIITPQRKKQRNLIIVFGLVLITTLSVLYLGMKKGGRVPISGIGKTPAPVSIQPAEEIKLDLDFFKNERFRLLAPYAKIPADVSAGRANPFLPY